MAKIFERLRERYPLLERTAITRPLQSPNAENFPLFIRIAISALETSLQQPLCLVLPRCGETPRVASVLYALLRFQSRSTADLHKRALGLQQGQTVRINPSRHVFIYDGLREDDHSRFWLRTLDRMRRMDFPLSAIVRLEPTTRIRPAGNIGTHTTTLRDPPQALVDRLLDLSTFGNLSHAVNEVLVLDSQSGFEEFTRSSAIHNLAQRTGFPAIASLVPFGTVVPPSGNDASWFCKWNDGVPSGEPLAAVTSNIELMRDCCVHLPMHSKLVVMNGLSRALRNQQAFDDIAQMQRLVLFTDSDDTDTIEAIGSRGCLLWAFGDAEFQNGDRTPHVQSVGATFAPVFRWARNRAHFSLVAEPCPAGVLDDIALLLQGLQPAVDASEDGPLAKCVGRAWRLLNEAAAFCRAPSSIEQLATLAQVAELKGDIRRNLVWTSKDAAQTLEDVTTRLEGFFGGSQGTSLPKGDALLRIVGESLKCGSVGVIAKTDNQAKGISCFLSGRSLSVPTFSLRTLTDETVLDQLIMVSWLGADQVRAVASKLSAPKLVLLAYPFENRWLKQTTRRISPLPNVRTITKEQKVTIIGLPVEAGMDWPESEAPTERRQQQEGPMLDFDIWRFEQRLRATRKGTSVQHVDPELLLQARYISFVGSGYAFVTPTHQIPVASELIASPKQSSQKLPERPVADLRRGDFVVFPESGNKELILELADRLLGTEALGLRNASRLWRDALVMSELTPAAFHFGARQLGLVRHPMTIRGWFASNSQIGPHSKDDLLVIALVTGNNELESKIDAVWQAIENLRSAHLSAGMKLRRVLLDRLPSVMGDVGDNGSKVDLGELGSAWVVQIEEIADKDEARLRNEVNRLLWD